MKKPCMSKYIYLITSLPVIGERHHAAGMTLLHPQGNSIPPQGSRMLISCPLPLKQDPAIRSGQLETNGTCQNSPEIQ
jgi:hypothetical protein